MISPIIQNFEFNTQSNFSLQSINLGLSIKQALIELVKDAKSMEKGNFKLFSDKQETQIHPKVIDFFIHLKLLSQQLVLSNPTHLKNPYLQALLNESQNLSHSFFWGGQMPYLALNDYCIDSINRLTENIMIKECALKFSVWKSEINIQTTEKKRKFDGLLKKHKQLNCIFIELPCIADQIISGNRTLEQKEAFWIIVVKLFLKKCHSSEVLENQLCDVQWRFVKGLDGILTAHILIYVVGEKINDLSFLTTYWNEAIIEKGLNIISTYIPIQNIYCYQGNGLASKQWKNLIDCCQAPLEFYRYKANGLSYVWKAYTGNV